MKMTFPVGRYLKRKTMLVWVKEYVKKLCNLHKSLKLARTTYCFQRKTPKCKYWVLKVLCLEIQMVHFSWLKNQSLCLRLYRSSKCCNARRCNGLGSTYKDLIKKIVYNSECNKCIMYWCESCPGTTNFKEFLDEELNEREDDRKFNYCQWDTTDQAILTTFTATYEEYKETLINVIDDLTRHSYIAKLKITSSWCRSKSKTTTGVKNLQVTSFGCILFGTRW